MVHVVNIGVFVTDGNNVRINKDALNNYKLTQLSHLIIPNSTVVTSIGYPTIKSYLESEAENNYILEMINETTIITKQIIATGAGAGYVLAASVATCTITGTITGLAETGPTNGVVWQNATDYLVFNTATDYIIWQ